MDYKDKPTNRSTKTIPVVAALITKGNKFLIAQRSKGELAGFWEFPGGKVELGETLHETIIREIKEELGIEILTRDIVSQFMHEYSFATIDLALIHCRMKDLNQEIESDGSHKDFKWISLEYAKLFEFAPLDKKIISFLGSNTTTILS